MAQWRKIAKGRLCSPNWMNLQRIPGAGVHIQEWWVPGGWKNLGDSMLYWEDGSPWTKIHLGLGQALTGTRYPTLPGFNFYYPNPTRKFFENFRVQGSNFTIIHAVSTQDYINDASYLAPEDSEICK